MYMKNYELHILGDVYDAVQFGSGEHLVLIPGLGDGITTVKGKALMGSLMFRRYGKRYTVTVISRKRVLEPDADTCTMARDQAYAMEALGIQKAHVVGISQGGMIAQHLAADHPELIDKLVLAVTTPTSNDRIRLNLRRWVELARKGAFTGLMTDIQEKAQTGKRRKYMRPFYSQMGAAIRNMDVERFAIMAQACGDHDASDKLDRITAPTLVIGAAQDQTVEPDGSHMLHRLIGGSALRIFEDQGHAVYENEPKFHELILDFLENGPED